MKFKKFDSVPGNFNHQLITSQKAFGIVEVTTPQLVGTQENPENPSSSKNNHDKNSALKILTAVAWNEDKH